VGWFAQTGLYTYDPGFTATGSCSSAITFIDGDKGLCAYRGYPVEQLAENSNFLEVSHQGNSVYGCPLDAKSGY
jgi:citrate synthase